VARGTVFGEDDDLPPRRRSYPPVIQSADRNLLLGILALQTDFITRDALIAAMLAWSVAKHSPLEDILVDQGALDPADRDLLRPMVDLCFTPSFETQVGSRPRSPGPPHAFTSRTSAARATARLPVRITSVSTG
jgi:hypothetical protein